MSETNFFKPKNRLSAADIKQLKDAGIFEKMEAIFIRIDTNPANYRKFR